MQRKVRHAGGPTPINQSHAGSPDSRFKVLAGRRRTPLLEYLDKIMQSKCFRQSEFLKRLLKFLVIKVVHSQEYQIKEYSLGTEVFQRKDNFDPRSDTIVRVQVHRLRAKLERYYKTEGVHDPIRFEIPKGSYVPLIVHREPIDLPCKSASSRSPSARCRVAVLPFSNLSEDGSIGNLADAITETLIDDLTMVGGLDVISRTSAYTFKQQYKDVRVIGRHLSVDAILEGSVRRSVEVVRIRARLVNARTGFTLWTATFDSKGKDLLTIEKEISEGIVPNIKSLLLPRHPAKQNLPAVQQQK